MKAASGKAFCYVYIGNLIMYFHEREAYEWFIFQLQDGYHKLRGS